MSLSITAYYQVCFEWQTIIVFTVTPEGNLMCFCTVFNLFVAIYYTHSVVDAYRKPLKADSLQQFVAV